MRRKNGLGKVLTMFFQITITMLSPILICGWIGLWLNARLHTTLCFLVMMLLGVLAAFRNFYHLVRGFFEDDLKRENAQQEYFDRMKRERQKKAEENRNKKQE